MSLFNELKRRNVFRVAIAYVVVAWLIIQVVETIFPAFGFGNIAVRIVVIVLAIGLVPALILPWAFELTPEGLKKENDLDRNEPYATQAGKKLDRWIMLVLAMGLSFFAFDKFVLDPARDQLEIETARQEGHTEALVESYGEQSIAVLPFVNLSSDPEQEYFSDGISEELLNLLARVPDLRVISRSSAFAFKDRDIDISEIAEHLNVAHILEGSVRKAGNSIRVSVQLIDARTNTNIWSESYDRESSDIFAIQDEISAQVVAQLQLAILGETPKSDPIDPEAYNLFLRGRHISHSFQADPEHIAEKLLKQSLAIEPNYVPALGELGRVYLNWPNNEVSDAELQRRIRSIVNRMELAAPGHPTVFGWRAYIADQDLDPVTAARFYERALAIDPHNAGVLRGVISFLLDQGNLQDAVVTAEYLVQQDPLCVMCLQHLSWAYRATGEYERAVEVLQEAVEWNPNRGLIYWSLGSVLLMAGRPQEALEAFELEESEMGGFGRIFALHDLGRQDEFEDAFGAMLNDPEPNPEAIARIYAWMGETELAIESLQKILDEQGAGEIGSIISGGFYRKIEPDPLFEAFLRKNGQHPDMLKPVPFNFTPPKHARMND